MIDGFWGPGMRCVGRRGRGRAAWTVGFIFCSRGVSSNERLDAIWATMSPPTNPQQCNVPFLLPGMGEEVDNGGAVPEHQQARLSGSEQRCHCVDKNEHAAAATHSRWNVAMGILHLFNDTGVVLSSGSKLRGSKS